MEFVSHPPDKCQVKCLHFKVIRMTSESHNYFNTFRMYKKSKKLFFFMVRLIRRMNDSICALTFPVIIVLLSLVMDVCTAEGEFHKKNTSKLY